MPSKYIWQGMKYIWKGLEIHHYRRIAFILRIVMDAGGRVNIDCGPLSKFIQVEMKRPVTV